MEKEDFIGMNLSEDISDEDFRQIADGYEKIKDQMSKEEFISKFNEFKAENEDISFFSDLDFLNMVVEPLSGEKNESNVENDLDKPVKISDVEIGNEDFTVIVRVMGISNVKKFKSRTGNPGRLCNIQIADNTDELRCVLWTQNIRFIKQINEGDIIKISDIECREGYRGGKEFSLRPRSDITVLTPESGEYPTDIDDYPVYDEDFTPIAELRPDETASILARVIRVPEPHSYQSASGKKGKVTSIEVQDATGKISYTLWNNDVNLIEDLALKVGDIVKILNEQIRERNGELSISHWDGRISKAEGDYDIPEFKEEIVDIAIAQDMEAKDVTLMGIVTKIFDVIEFDRQDSTKGFVRSIEIADSSSSIRVTFWGDDAKKELNKGDILKITGGNIEVDDFSPTGYRINTNWNSEIIVNPDEDNQFIEELKSLSGDFGPVDIVDIQEIDDDGEEIDIVARLITLSNIRNFERDDGSKGTVCSADFADATGNVRVSFWDEKTGFPFEIGRAYKLENARTRPGMYAVELNAGKPTRVIPLSEDDAGALPSFEELENRLYEPMKIGDLDEDTMNFKVVGRILELTDAREFDRQDGGKGLVRSMEVGDDTGIIRASLWDDKAKIPCDIGDPVKIQNPTIRFNNNNEIELSVGGASNIIDPNDDELATIPTIEELEELLYVSKQIAELDDEDKNVRVKGIFGDVYGGRLLTPRCPFCNNTLEDDDECSYCGNHVDEPNYLLMIPGRLEDSTGNIQITFFSNLAEELLGMKLDKMIELIEDSGDEGVLENKVEKLEGLTIEVLADVSFNEYNEENRLRPKRIFSVLL